MKALVNAKNCGLIYLARFYQLHCITLKDQYQNVCLIHKYKEEKNLKAIYIYIIIVPN